MCFMRNLSLHAYFLFNCVFCNQFVSDVAHRTAMGALNTAEEGGETTQLEETLGEGKRNLAYRLAIRAIGHVRGAFGKCRECPVFRRGFP